MKQNAYASHNIFNRGECKGYVKEELGLSKKEANELCDRDYDLFFYNGKHCRNFFEEREGYSEEQAKDICQFIFTHKFQKSNP